MQATLPSLALPPVVEEQVVNVATVRHRSPFRYPGGKTWLVPRVNQWLTSIPKRPAIFCEPFCGGGNVGLSVLFDGLAERVVLVELDRDVASVWQVILNGHAKRLETEIGDFEMSLATVRSVLDRKPRSRYQRAFATILRNRVQRGGILAPGASLMKDGENGRGLKSRWYAGTLQSRIREISKRKKDVTFVQGDGIACMREHANRADMVFFIDPPYTVAGRRLYAHSEIDHEELFRVASQLEGDVLMTYDDAEPIRELAKRYHLDVHAIPMKNTHHRIMHELLIGRDLAWARMPIT